MHTLASNLRFNIMWPHTSDEVTHCWLNTVFTLVSVWETAGFWARGNWFELCGGHSSVCDGGRTDWIHTGEPSIIFQWNELWPRITRISFLRSCHQSHFAMSEFPNLGCPVNLWITVCSWLLLWSFHVHKDKVIKSCLLSPFFFFFLTWKNMKKKIKIPVLKRWIQIQNSVAARNNSLIKIQYADKWSKDQSKFSKQMEMASLLDCFC